MSQTTVNISGAWTDWNGNAGIWHELHNSTPGYGGCRASGNITFTRSSEDNPTITFSGTLYNTVVGSGNPHYGYTVGWGIIRGGTLYTNNNAVDDKNKYIGGSYSILVDSTAIGQSIPIANDGSKSVNVSASFTSTTNETLYIGYYCHQSGGCQLGYNGTSSNPASSFIVVGTLNTANIPFNNTSGPTSCTINTNSAKPDQSVTVQWSGQTGSINHFQMEISSWRNGSQVYGYKRITGPLYYTDVGQNPCTWSTDFTNLKDYDNGTNIIILPGDTVQLHVVTYSGSGYSGWVSTVTAKKSNNADISIYKDGFIKYKTGGSVKECVLAYKRVSSTNKPLRYVKVKNSSRNS